METLFILPCSSSSRLAQPRSLSPARPPRCPAAQAERPSQRSPSPPASAFALAAGRSSPSAVASEIPRAPGAEPAPASQRIAGGSDGQRCPEPSLSHAHAAAPDHPPLPGPPKGHRAPRSPAARRARRASCLLRCLRRARRAHGRGIAASPAHAPAPAASESQSG